MKKGIITLILATIACFVYSLPPVGDGKGAVRRGVPATPHPIEYVQPNGDTITIRLHGDERKHWKTTLDGFLVAQNKKGIYCYAKYNTKGYIVPTCRKAHDAEKRTEKEQKWVEKYIVKFKL